MYLNVDAVISMKRKSNLIDFSESGSKSLQEIYHVINILLSLIFVWRVSGFGDKPIITDRM